MMSSDDVKTKRLFEYYSDVVNCRRQNRSIKYSKLRGKVAIYLEEVAPENRVNPQLCLILLQCAENDSSSWRLDMALEVMLRMEEYALNLLDYPWKLEFHTVKVI